MEHKIPIVSRRGARNRTDLKSSKRKQWNIHYSLDLDHSHPIRFTFSPDRSLIMHFTRVYLLLLCKTEDIFIFPFEVTQRTSGLFLWKNANKMNNFSLWVLILLDSLRSTKDLWVFWFCVSNLLCLDLNRDDEIHISVYKYWLIFLVCTCLF